jgi:hypothetical protein
MNHISIISYIFMKIRAVNSENYQGNCYAQSPGTNNITSFEDIVNIEQGNSSIKKTALPLDTIILPTFSNLEKISGSLSGILSKFFMESGISTNPPVDISVNPYTNEIEISGGREDAAGIEEMINSNEDLKDKILTVNAIASHVCQMPEHLAFQKEYFESDYPEQVLAKYSHLFSDNNSEHSISFKFSPGGLEIYYDGEPWSYK